MVIRLVWPQCQLPYWRVDRQFSEKRSSSSHTWARWKRVNALSVHHTGERFNLDLGMLWIVSAVILYYCSMTSSDTLCDVDWSVCLSSVRRHCHVRDKRHQDHWHRPGLQWWIHNVATLPQHLVQWYAHCTSRGDTNLSNHVCRLTSRCVSKTNQVHRAWHRSTM